MIYNDFNGMSLSRLGFGCMRLPVLPDSNVPDQEKVTELIKYAYEHGVNYFDTAYPYHAGKSETALAEALKDIPRENYYLANKFPGHSFYSPVDNSALFELQLKRCRTDFFDFYLLHNINEWSISNYESPDFHIFPDILKKKEEGKIRHLGFSFHGGPELLEAFLTKHEGMFEFVQIQCNYLDWTLQSAKQKYDIITKHGLGVWIMEPLRGGKLANLPDAAHEKLAAFGRGESDAAYAFRFLQALPNIKVVLSGMNAMDQLTDNLATFDKEAPLTEEETNVLLEIAEDMKKGVPCTACRYCCDGCPMELDIPTLLGFYNNYKYDPRSGVGIQIDGLDESKRPAACIQCGQCAHACPQQINVPEALAELAELYAKAPKWSDTIKVREKDIRKDLNMD